MPPFDLLLLGLSGLGLLGLGTAVVRHRNQQEPDAAVSAVDLERLLFEDPHDWIKEAEEEFDRWVNGLPPVLTPEKIRNMKPEEYAEARAQILTVNDRRQKYIEKSREENRQLKGQQVSYQQAYPINGPRAHGIVISTNPRTGNPDTATVTAQIKVVNRQLIQYKGVLAGQPLEPPHLAALDEKIHDLEVTKKMLEDELRRLQ